MSSSMTASIHWAAVSAAGGSRSATSAMKQRPSLPVSRPSTSSDRLHYEVPSPSTSSSPARGCRTNDGMFELPLRAGTRGSSSASSARRSGPSRCAGLRRAIISTTSTNKLARVKGRNGTGLAPKTILEVHVIIRAALAEATERELVNRNVASTQEALGAPANAPARSWTSAELRTFLTAARRNGATRHCISLRTLGCAAGRSSDSAGRTSTSTNCDCRSARAHRRRLQDAPPTQDRQDAPPIDLDPPTVAYCGASARNYRSSEEWGRRLDPTNRYSPTATAPPSTRTTTPRPSSGRLSPASPSSALHDAPPHPRHDADQGRRSRQGRQRATRPRHTGVHHRHVPARPARHAGRRRSVFEAPPDLSKRTRAIRGKARRNTACTRKKADQPRRPRSLTWAFNLRWWRGQDLNLRPSGYEPSAGVRRSPW